MEGSKYDFESGKLIIASLNVKSIKYNNNNNNFFRIDSNGSSNL